MKFLAILKDSLLEALDTKVLYVTLALSLLFVLTMFSISFQPMSVEEQANRLATDLNANTDQAFALQKFNGGAQPPHVHVAGFNEINPSGQPWERGYHFELVTDLFADVPEDLRKDLDKQQAMELSRILPRIMYWAKDLKVVPDEKAAANELRIRVDIEHTNAANRLEWPHEPRALFGAIPLRWLTMPLDLQLLVLTNYLVGWVGASVTILLSIIVTAFFIPNMLRKGTVDLLIAKPIHRTTLLLFKFVGGLTFMLLNTIVIMGGLYLALGIRAGVWMPGLLLCIGIFTFQFAIFYALSTASAVITRSPIVAILICVVAWGALLFIGWGYRIIDSARPEKLAKSQRSQDREIVLPGWLYTTADTIHLLTPHYNDLDVLTTQTIRSDLSSPDSKSPKNNETTVSSINWPETLTVTIFYIVALVGFSCWWFASKDY